MGCCMDTAKEGDKSKDKKGKETENAPKPGAVDKGKAPDKPGKVEGAEAKANP